MKYGILITLIFTSVSAFSAEPENFQEIAGQYFVGRTSVETKKNGSNTTETVNFNQQIDNVIVNRVDNPIRLFGFISEAAGAGLMATRHIVKEIYLNAGSQQLNCYVIFESEIAKRELKVKELLDCSDLN